MLLITGATGNVGGKLVHLLTEQGHAVRALVRNPAKANLPEGVEVVVGDLDDPASINAAAEGVEAIFHLQASPFATQTETIIAAARAAGVDRIVALTSIGAVLAPLPTMGAFFRAREDLLRASGLKVTYLRPNTLMTNALWWRDSIRETGTVSDPCGEGRMPCVDSDDIAAVAAATLTQPGHEGHGYILNKGIGLETVRRLIGAGHRVYLGARDEERGRAAAEDAGASFVQLDVTSDGSVRRAAASVEHREDHLDVLINNAGITGPSREARDYDGDDAAAVLLTNVVGYVRVIHTFLPLLERSAEPRIVNVSSGLGSFGLFHDADRIESRVGTPLYGAAKAAINMLTARYAQQLPNIRINAADPGMTATDLTVDRVIRSATAPTPSSPSPSAGPTTRPAPSATATATCPGEHSS